MYLYYQPFHLASFCAILWPTYGTVSGCLSICLLMRQTE